MSYVGVSVRALPRVALHVVEPAAQTAGGLVLGVRLPGLDYARVLPRQGDGFRSPRGVEDVGGAGEGDEVAPVDGQVGAEVAVVIIGFEVAVPRGRGVVVGVVEALHIVIILIAIGVAYFQNLWLCDWKLTSKVIFIYTLMMHS